MSLFLGRGPSLVRVAACVASFGALAALDSMLIGCGRKSAPRPPEFVVPESPAPVRVTPVTDGLQITWRRPRQYFDGTNLEDLGSFDVYRSCDSTDDWVPIAVLPVTDRERFRKGKTFAFIDRTVNPDATCRYRVVASTLDGYRSPPAEGAPGDDPEPSPAPTDASLPPDGAPDPSSTPAPAPREAEEPWRAEEERLPAPLVSPTPFPDVLP